jgi:spore germination protein KA
MSIFNLQTKIDGIMSQFHQSGDIASRMLEKEKGKLGFVYLKSMTDQELFATAIYRALQNYDGTIDADSLQNKVLQGNDIKEIKEDEIIENILKGGIIIFIEGESKILSVDLLKYPTRTPSEPPTSPVIQGPREGFVEDIKTNVTLLRRRIHSKDLVFKTLNVGKYSNTQIMVSYIDGIADKKIVDEVIKKLKKIDIDGIVDSFYILTFLEKRPDSIFKQIGNTEKPDIVAGKMLEGRVAIIVDNSPIVLTVPFVLLEEMQSSNDYYTNHHYSSFVRVIRLLGLLVAIMSPGLYLALELHHYNVLPLNFLITIADTTQGLPFTPFIEIMFIFILFQMLYEVSLRLPSYLGLATSVVGALILGDTGVKAGLISPPGVIVVALAKIALYTIPEQSSQISILQVIFIFIGGSLGLAGLVTGIVYFVTYLNGLDSFDTPYLAPYSPRIPSDLKDGIFKRPVTEMKTRPRSIKNKNKVRLK